jgi:hypothetical protein
MARTMSVKFELRAKIHDLTDELAEAKAALAASAARIEAKDRDIGHLIAIIRFMEEATGESLGAEDAALVYQIERDRVAPQPSRED